MYLLRVDLRYGLLRALYYPGYWFYYPVYRSYLKPYVDPVRDPLDRSVRDWPRLKPDG